MGIHLTTRIKRGFNQTEQRLGSRHKTMGIHPTTRIKIGFNQTEQRLGIRQWVPYDQCRIKGRLNRKKLVRGFPFNYRNIRRLELRLASTPGEFLSIQLGYIRME